MEQETDYSGSKLITLYTVLRNMIVGFISGWKTLLSQDGGSSFYYKIFTIFSTMLLYFFGYLSLKVLNVVMFVNVLIKSMKYLNSADLSYSSEDLLQEWATYGSLLVLSSVFDLLPSIFAFGPFVLILGLCKLFLCYKLITDDNFYANVLHEASRFYAINKTGINAIHNIGNDLAYKLKTMCELSIKN